MGSNVHGRGRYMDSLVNQPTFGGSAKKAGLASTVGLPASVSGVYRFKLGCPCEANKYIISTTRTSCRVGCPAGILFYR
jgi:hypothetical protein